LNIPLITASVTPKDNSEASCRQARQEVFKKQLTQNDCLITAHHQNDQIETVLFRLFRGTGLQGMTGISQTNQFDHYTIHRPLLSVTKNQIKDYVTTNQLNFVEDPSNQDNFYSRNHIRNIILPELNKYNNKASRNINLTALNLSHSQQLLSLLIGKNNPLNYKLFTDKGLLSTALYQWLHNLNLLLPSHKRLTQYSDDCLKAAPDKNPELLLDGCRIIRWSDHIYALKNLRTSQPKETSIEINSNEKYICLPDNGQLSFKSNKHICIPAKIKYQQSFERIKTNKNEQHKKLKNLFQQLRIPPWERKMIPYLYIDNHLMAVGSKIISYEFQTLLTEYNAEYRWLSPQYIL